MSEPMRPSPAPWVTRESAFFWEAARREQLVGQRCAACGRLRAPPRPMCPHCQSVEREEQVLSGRGRVYSWAIPRHPVIPGFEQTTVVAVIELDEGIRMVSNLCGIEPARITADMPVEVFFEPTRDDFKIPLFRPLSPGAGGD